MGLALQICYGIVKAVLYSWSDTIAGMIIVWSVVIPTVFIVLVRKSTSSCLDNQNEKLQTLPVDESQQIHSKAGLDK